MFRFVVIWFFSAHCYYYGTPFEYKLSVFSHNPARVAESNNARRNILGYHAACAYDGIRADSYTAQDYGIAAYPNVIADLNRQCVLQAGIPRRGI